MVKKIMRDPLFLAQKSVDATEDDKMCIRDSLLTSQRWIIHRKSRNIPLQRRCLPL